MYDEAVDQFECSFSGMDGYRARRPCAPNAPRDMPDAAAVSVQSLRTKDDEVETKPPSTVTAPAKIADEEC